MTESGSFRGTFGTNLPGPQKRDAIFVEKDLAEILRFDEEAQSWHVLRCPDTRDFTSEEEVKRSFRSPGFYTTRPESASRQLRIQGCNASGADVGRWPRLGPFPDPSSHRASWGQPARNLSRSARNWSVMASA